MPDTSTILNLGIRDDNTNNNANHTKYTFYRYLIFRVQYYRIIERIN